MSHDASSASSCRLLVISPVEMVHGNDDNDDDKPVVSESEQRLDALDDFNHPRIRRAHILTAFQSKYGNLCSFECPTAAVSSGNEEGGADYLRKRYHSVHSTGLINFLWTAWTQWKNLRKEIN